MNRFGLALASLAIMLEVVTGQAMGEEARLLVAARGGKDQKDQLLLLDLAGQIAATLTDGKSHDYLPAWSPDGKSIAFSSTRSGVSSIHVMDADGRNVRQLTSEALCRGPAWSPDGSRIAMTRNVPGANPTNPEVFVMDADGENLVNLTSNAAFDGSCLVQRIWNSPTRALGLRLVTSASGTTRCTSRPTAGRQFAVLLGSVRAERRLAVSRQLRERSGPKSCP